jgi:hypothetical protein
MRLREGRIAKKKRLGYRFFFVRRLFLGVEASEKLVDVRNAGSIGAALAVVLTLTLPAGVNVVFVRMRMRFLPGSSSRRRRGYPQRSGSKRQKPERRGEPGWACSRRGNEGEKERSLPARSKEYSTRTGGTRI